MPPSLAFLYAFPFPPPHLLMVSRKDCRGADPCDLPGGPPFGPLPPSFCFFQFAKKPQPDGSFSPREDFSSGFTADECFERFSTRCLLPAALVA